MLLVGVVVVFVGLISFVGLVVLYVVCLLVGFGYCWLLLLFGLLGVLLIVVVDIVVCMFDLLVEILLGLFLVVLGVLFFFWLVL